MCIEVHVSELAAYKHFFNKKYFCEHLCVQMQISICFPVIHQLLVFSRHSWQFNVLSDVEFLFHDPLNFQFSFYFGLSSFYHQVIIRMGHLLSSMPTTYAYHFNMLFSMFCGQQTILC